jgi:EAL domain-containing protein (putative c-di-GMP-specific phosphodiesterase class I)
MTRTGQLDVGEAHSDLDALTADMRDAIGTPDLGLVFQPKFDLRTDHVVGFEALARWNHRTHGPLSPAGFIAFSERVGLIREVSAWVMHCALAQLAAWQRAGHDVSVAVNTAPSTLAMPWFIPDVRDAIRTTGVEPNAVVFEVGERTLMADFEQSVAVLTELRSLGPWTAVDDYGTGYSNLSFLRRLPVRELNIDRAIVSGIALNNADRSIVRSVIDLAHRLGIVAVAEGVEHPAVLQVLRSIGCDQAQGYLLGTPVDAATATALLSRGGLSTVARRSRRPAGRRAVVPLHIATSS